MERGYARGRARDDAIRAQLVPLAPGERPRAVTVAALAAAFLCVANLVATLLGNPSSTQWRFTAIQCAVLLAAAIGMWRVRYWAVLGFQALLGITMVVAFLALLRGVNLRASLYCVGLIALSAPMFWFLVRAMARIQMPERARRTPGS